MGCTGLGVDENVTLTDNVNAKMEVDEGPGRQENGMGDAPIADSERLKNTDELPSLREGKSPAKVSAGDQTDMKE